MVEFTVFFLIGLLGSAHCLGMCGPIVLAYSANMKPSAAGSAKPGWIMITRTFAVHLTYNMGRVGMWVFLGAVLGLTGGVVKNISAAGEFISVAGGITILLLGIGNLGFLPKFSIGEKPAGPVLSIYSRLFQILIRENSFGSKFVLGIANGLLPCGLSYALLAKAATSSSAVTGGSTMLAFGLGTVPALVGVGLLSSVFSQNLRLIGQKIAALAVIIMGTTLILRGFGVHLSFLHSEGLHHLVH